CRFCNGPWAWGESGRIGSGQWTPVRRIERCQQKGCESSSFPLDLLGTQLAGILDGPDHRHRYLHRNRIVLGQLEDLDDALAAIDLCLCLGVQFRAEAPPADSLPISDPIGLFGCITASFG